VRTLHERPVVECIDGGLAAASISHSGDEVLCALGRVRAIGVDIEQVRPRADWNRLSEWVLHAKEKERIAASGRRWEGFYALWTFKEALAKALGVGVFGLPFHKIALSDEGSIEELPADCGIEAAVWQLRRLERGEGIAAAVAWRA
jgi:4'-phosphopantetheinyl transferase